MIKEKDAGHGYATLAAMGQGSEKVVIDRDMLVNSVTVEPEIPVFISYFTCYPSSDGELRYYKDVYGYDEAIWKELKYYLL